MTINQKYPQHQIKPLAWVVLSPNGNIRMWSENIEPVRELANRVDGRVVPVYAATPNIELLSALERLRHVCSLALAGKDGTQHAYFETRAGHFVEATEAMKSAEAAIASAKARGSMIKITDYKGRTHYVSPSAIAKISEAGASSQWHGIRCIVKCFDDSIIEAGDTADQIAEAVAAAKGGTA